jgi:serine/threonine-protein kinase RsbW
MHPDPLTTLMNKAKTLPHPTKTPTDKIHLIFPASPNGVRKALADTLEKLRFLELSIEETGTVELVLAEVMNNITEHAYADYPDGMIDLQITPTSRGLYCKVSDSGKPMPKGAAPLGSRALLDCELNDLPEGGFGWFLIRDLARDLEYSRVAGKNLLNFRIATNQPDLLAN